MYQYWDLCTNVHVLYMLKIVSKYLESPNREIVEERSIVRKSSWEVIDIKPKLQTNLINVLNSTSDDGNKKVATDQNKRKSGQDKTLKVEEEW